MDQIGIRRSELKVVDTPESPSDRGTKRGAGDREGSLCPPCHGDDVLSGLRTGLRGHLVVCESRERGVTREASLSPKWDSCKTSKKLSYNAKEAAAAKARAVRGAEIVQGLSLDPQRNPHHHHPHLHSHLPLHQSTLEEEEEEQQQQQEQEQEQQQQQQQQQQQGFHGLFHPNLHPNQTPVQQQQQVLYEGGGGARSLIELAQPPKKRSSVWGENGEAAEFENGVVEGRHGWREIVEVQGGHIVRSTGRKDRHSKVCTAKGPRDRRVRLSAHTAIQFYDVQDRLGYDRPSKAVDWLIKKAKPAIDELAELPPWRPTATTITPTSTVNVEQPQGEENSNSNQQEEQQEQHEQQDQQDQQDQQQIVDIGSSIAKRPIGDVSGFQFSNPNSSSTSSIFLPPQLDSHAIADTIKSFFPTAAQVSATSSSSMPFQTYPSDLLSRSNSHSQDLRLSLHSFHHHHHHPILLHHHQQQQSASSPAQHALFPSTSNAVPLAFDAGSAAWSEQQQEMGRFQRMVAWNVSAADTGNAAAAGGDYVFNSLPQPQAPQPQSPLQLLHGQGPVFSQRGPLQSSNSPQIRAWIDQSYATAEQHHISALHQSSSVSGIGGFASGAGGFPGFRIPARIQGEEEHDANKPPSSASRRH
ncbi:hypothetical protein Sjap_000440 [Stephania japonica]|uniref:TCP domain-containing protein n=1 Tax=Stephania japonica TaxID=461633 RepID=A0AAP0KJ06_9MAGN